MTLQEKQDEEYCTVVTLDARNAFNSASLFNMATPPHLMEILNNYFQYREVIYLTDEAEQEYVMTRVSHIALYVRHYYGYYIRLSTSTVIAKGDYNCVLCR